MKLLCIADLQREFVTPVCRTILPNVIRLIDYFNAQHDAIIFTKHYNSIDSPHGRLLDKSQQDLLPELGRYAQRVFPKYGYSIWTKAVSRYLDTQKIKQLFFAGVGTDACIYISALQAFDQRIQPIVIEDACMSCVDQRYHRAAIQLLKRQIGDKNVVCTDDITGVSYQAVNT